MRPRLLDLFSGSGGGAVGYHRAGFDLFGIDHEPRPRKGEQPSLRSTPGRRQ